MRKREFLSFATTSEYICQKVVLALDFSSERLNIKEEETAITRRQRSDKKRKASGSSI